MFDAIRHIKSEQNGSWFVTSFAYDLSEHESWYGVFEQYENPLGHKKTFVAVLNSDSTLQESIL